MAEGKSRIFSFSLVSKNTAKVNALVFGVGLDMTFSDKTYPLKVNVINIEANPIAPLVFLYGANRLKFPQNPNIVFKGLDITTGRCGVNSVVDVTGISFSGFSYGYSNTGITITGLYNYSTVLKGVYISGLSNTSQSGSGLFIAAFNTSENLYGIEIGGYNDSVDMHGIQIGLVNMTNRQKGIQLGIWNINGKRSMPFINWKHEKNNLNAFVLLVFNTNAQQTAIDTTKHERFKFEAGTPLSHWENYQIKLEFLPNLAPGTEVGLRIMTC